MSRILVQVREKLEQSLKARDERTVSSLRLLLSSCRNEEINKRKELSDEEVLSLIRKQVKNHNESIEAFQKAGRLDLVKKEEEEKAAIVGFLPQKLPEEEIKKVVREVLVSGVKDFGQVMGQVMGRVKGQADGATVARMVREEL